jgi:hypothetical protein
MAEQILFDRLVYVDRLRAAGISEEQARAQAGALHAALHESVATKADIARLEQKIELAVRDLTIRMGVGGAAIVAILASLKFFG